jgi:hypothetical protein
LAISIDPISAPIGNHSTGLVGIVLKIARARCRRANKYRKQPREN